MNRQPIVSILGNSVPLLIQPWRTRPTERAYPEHLRDRGFDVLNGTKQSAIISDLYLYLEDECIRQAPDFVVMHFGIVECTYRTRPRWLQNVWSMNAWNNSIIRRGYNGPLTRGLKYLTKKIATRTIERWLFALGIKWRWLGPKDFRFILRDVTKRIFQDTPAKKIVLIGMLPVADWIEQKAPGTQASITQYNAIMADLAEECPDVRFLQPAEATGGRPLTDLSSDGIHFTAEGHRRLAETIIGQLNGERTTFTGWLAINQYDRLYGIYARWFKRQAPRSK